MKPDIDVILYHIYSIKTGIYTVQKDELEELMKPVYNYMYRQGMQVIYKRDVYIFLGESWKRLCACEALFID